MKTIIIAVTNDLVNDQRVLRVISSVKKSGYRIIFIGRCLRNSPAVNSKDFLPVRFRLFFNKGFLFYAEFNIRLFLFLLFYRANFYIANDLDTLPAMYMASKLKGVTLIYDSHEFFTGLHEIQERKCVKKVWEGLEKFIFPKLKYTITVNDSIAGLFYANYGKRPLVIRNFAHYRKPGHTTSDLPFKTNGKKFFIIQGTGINFGRGVEEATLAMKFIDDALLVIVGKGLALPGIKKLIQNESLQNKIILIETLPYDQLIQITAGARAGISLDKPLSLNYLYSLPNKISDYVQAGIPQIVSNIPEVAKLVNQYGIGMVCPNAEPEEIARCYNLMLNDDELYRNYKHNIESAAKELCWEREENKLIELYAKAGILF